MSVDSMPIQWALRGVIVRLPDEIDHLNVERVRSALSDALDAAPAVLVADMTGTTYCSVERVRALLRTHHAARQAGIPMRIAGVHLLVRRILALTGASEVLDVYPSIKAAVAISARTAGT